jgi:hypothetical protein
MEVNRTVSRRCCMLARTLATVAAAAALTLGILPGATVPAVRAHETDCAFCKLPVVQDTATQDNEVALRYGRKRIEYRCLVCALADAKTAYKGDVTILAPSETKNKPVVITRNSGRWSAGEGAAAFLSDGHDNHRVCYLTNRAFGSRAALDAYVKKNGAKVTNAKPTTLDQLVANAAR